MQRKAAMHESIRLLNAAMDLARQEAQALAAEDEELLESLCAEREELMAKAWERRDGCDAKELEVKLREAQALQDGLTHTARAQAETLREALKGSRKQGKGLSGYHKASSGPVDAVYLQRRS